MTAGRRGYFPAHDCRIGKGVEADRSGIMYHITLGLDLESVAKAADVVVEYTTNTEDEYT